jgi:hypothetical protein
MKLWRSRFPVARTFITPIPTLGPGFYIWRGTYISFMDYRKRVSVSLNGVKSLPVVYFFVQVMAYQRKLKYKPQTWSTGDMGNSPSCTDRFGSLDRRSDISLTANPMRNLIIAILVFGTVLSIVFCLYKKRQSLDQRLCALGSSQYNSPIHRLQNWILSQQRISEVWSRAFCSGDMVKRTWKQPTTLVL